MIALKYNLRSKGVMLRELQHDDGSEPEFHQYSSSISTLIGILSRDESPQNGRIPLPLSSFQTNLTKEVSQSRTIYVFCNF